MDHLFQDAVKRMAERRSVRSFRERGYLNEIQRLFGIHYHPDRELDSSVIGRIHQQKLFPFSYTEQ